MATYVNRFAVHAGPMVRITLIDERPAVAEGVPASQTVAGEHVMSRDDALGLSILLGELIRKTDK